MSHQVRTAKRFVRGRRFLIAAAITMVAIGVGVSAGNSFLARAATATTDTCGYPVSGGTASRDTLAVVEPSTLPAFRPAAGGSIAPGSTMQAYFTDEHALTLGTASVTVGGVTTTYSPTPFVVTDSATHTGHSSSVNEGATIAQGGKDAQGRPLGPQLYITDITSPNASNPATPTSTADPNGDWQFTGTDGTAPNDVFGTWKNATVVNGVPADPADPTANTVLGPGADPLPILNNNGTTFRSLGFLTEARWTVDSNLKIGSYQLAAGHVYRLQFQVHDGDHGLDSGEACTTITVPNVTTVATGGTLQTDGTATISDTATVTGLSAPLPSGVNKVTFKVYGPDPTKGSDPTDDCTAGNFVGTHDVSLNSTTPSGSYPTSFTVTNAGDYHFTADLIVGGATVASSVCGAANETATVTSPKTNLTTDAGGPYQPTNSLTDVATLSGGTINAGGTITFKLFADNGSGGCGTQIGTSQVVSVNHGAANPGQQYQATVTDAAIHPGASGNATFHWTADYSGDPNNDPSQSICGAANENPVVLWPHISITKNPKNQTIEAAGNVELTPAPGTTPGKATWTLHVTNDGNTDLINVVVTDPNAPNCAQSVGNLAKGASVDVLPAQCLIAGLTGTSYHNQANVSGQAGNVTVTSSDTADVTIINPHIQVTKTPATQSVALGGIAHFTITVKNDGDVPLSAVVVTDVQVPACARTASQTAVLIANQDGGSFDPGDMFTYTCDSDPVQAPFTNAVGACGKDALNGTVCDNDGSTGTPGSDCTTAGGNSADQCAGVGIDSIASSQDFKPKDTATISVNGPHGALNGQVDFKLYKGACVASNRIYQDLNVPVNGSGQASTASADYLSTLLANAGLSTNTGGTYNWLLTYHGDTNGNAGLTSVCGTENFVVTNG